VFKKIELCGFKSFANRTAVDFTHGMTAIVGPNGCGKSNISDAIRWVLGEQSSKQLRGSNMQDVIFKGTDTKNQSSFCEVSLHFDNINKSFPVDFSEVVIGRKLYRSGESQYTLNNQPVRLKDIVSLLHDSGIDRDGMTIIGQGSVADLVNSKAESRRGIFEHTARIANFKTRRDEAERKLDRVSTNLTRVKDVIGEIERTLGPLMKQAENAKKYLELKEKLKILEINSYLYSYDTTAQNKAKITDEINKISETLSKRQFQIEELTAGSQNALTELSGLDAKAEAMREQILNLSVGLEKHRGEDKLVSEKLVLLRSQEQSNFGELEQLKVRLEIEQEKLKESQELFKKLESERAQADKNLLHEENKFRSFSEKKNKYNELRGVKERLSARKEALQNIIQSGEGYKFSVKKILEGKENNSMIANNIIGVVAKEINVPSHLETAVEVALGAAAQNIITESEDNAKTMIDLLAKNKWGRATFLPITSMRGRGLSREELLHLDEGINIVGVMADLITFKPKIAPAIISLLGRCVVVDGLDNAIKLAKSTRNAFKIVTLDGDVIETRGSITGGSKSNNNNVLYTKNTLEQLDKELEQIEIKLKALGEFNQENAYQTLTEQKIKLASTESEMNSLRKTIESTNATEKLLSENISARENANFSLQQSLEKTQKLSASDEDRRLYVEATTRLETAREELLTFDTRKEALRDYIVKAEEDKNVAIEEARQLHELYYKTQSKLERIDEENERLQNDIQESYGLNYSMCYQFKIENFDFDNAKPEIIEFKKSISRLGHVNLDAIDQSKDASSRFEEYSTQVNDLESAKADLEKIIAELSLEMEGKFRNTFDQVNKNFQTVFKELFGGGRAYLELTDPNNILECGIEIIAEPPGKKISNTNLLSGGEKALTAIAILFAILKLQPMPFCLLDEIEAALDEVNVARFASYLKNVTAAQAESQTATQFIVITHRKPTMELADHLYGITMQNKGISNVVSVKLEAYA